MPSQPPKRKYSEPAMSFECHRCNRTFSNSANFCNHHGEPGSLMLTRKTESSLVRHTRKSCNQPTLSKARRKSCNQCALAKAKCDLRRPVCGRCVSRGTRCTYPPNNQSTPEEVLTASDNSSLIDISEPCTAGLLENSRTSTDNSQSFSAAHLLDSGDDALSNINFPFPSTSTPDQNHHTGNFQDTISSLAHADLFNFSAGPADCELHPDLLGPVAVVPYIIAEIPLTDLTRNSMELIFRVMRTWPRMIAEAFQYPPVFHFSQLKEGGEGNTSLPLPLAKCFTLAKMWHGCCEGAEDIVRSTILKEVTYLLDQYKKYDESGLLATLQAMVMYTIMLLFAKSSSGDITTNHELFLAIQQVAYHAADTGLLLPEEQDQPQQQQHHCQQTLPTWQAWIHVTSKRRSVLSLYLLHWAYAVYHKIPSFNCKELGFIPAPAAKVLWHARSETEWHSLYIRWLARWDGRAYMQREFGEVQLGVAMDSRTERWLEETDEFGFIMISIMNATDRFASLAVEPLV